MGMYFLHIASRWERCLAESVEALRTGRTEPRRCASTCGVTFRNGALEGALGWLDISVITNPSTTSNVALDATPGTTFSTPSYDT